jgi:pyochelin synthetase
VLHFSIDFLICDFVSIQTLLDELRRRYDSPDEEPEPLEITYQDCLLADRALHSGELYERDKTWWLGRLDALPGAPELPLAPGVGPAGVSRVPVRFRRLAATLSPSEWAALRERARGHGITPSTVVLAAYAETIGRWSRLPHFTLNVTLLNRPPLHRQINQIVGDFTSVSMLAVDQRSDTPRHERARQIQATLWADLDHRLFSGVEVLREITRRRGGEGTLMPVVFTSAIGLGDGDAGFADLGYGISQTPQVWVDCQNIERQGGLATNWDVREGVFPDGLIDDAFAAYVELLRRLAAGDDAWSQTDFVAVPAAQLQRRAAVNATSTPYPDGLLHDGLLAQARLTPAAPVVLTPHATLTYAQLTGRAGAVAEALVDAGCASGDLVGVVAPKGVDQIVAVLGTLLAGGAYVPIDVNQPMARRDRILSSAGIVLVLTEAARADEAEWPEGVRVLAVDRIAGPDTPATTEPTQRRVGPDDLAYVIHTSGSTGAPKGVMISHRAALNTVCDINRRFDVGPADRVLGLASLGFDLSVYDIFGPPAVGAGIVLPAPDRTNDPTHWADLVATFAVTLWNSVPAQMQMLCDYLQAVHRLELPSLRLAMLSGDWIPLTLPDVARQRIPGLRVISLGGATEAAIWSIWYPIEEVDPAWRSIPYGVPLANQSFQVLDPALRPVPDWTVGELYIGGAGLAGGYLNDPEKTAERFITWPATGERLYRTGDLGRYLPDATIEFLGRDDFQVKIRGHRIELAEVEAALLSHPQVSAAAVVVVGERPLERRMVGFVETARAAATPAPPELVAVADAAGQAVLTEIDVVSYLDYLRRLDDAALDAAVDALRRAGLFLDPTRYHTRSEIEDVIKATPRHRRLLRRLLGALIGEGRLVGDAAGRLGLAAPAQPIDLAWARVSELAGAGGDSAQLLDYFRTSSTNLLALLRDEQDPLQLLFPQGRVELSHDLYAEALFNRWANRTAAAMVGWLAAGNTGPQPVRVLEVGAGDGGTTARVLAALDGVAFDYLSTDLSPFFVDESAKRFTDRDGVRFAPFDLERDYRSQGLSPNSYDLVVAGDVLHATGDAAACLAQLRELVRPGGYLVFVEMTRDHYQIMTSLELLVRLDTDLGDFTDVRRGTDQTFLSTDQWYALLGAAGAEVVACVPAEDEPFAAVGIRVFAARFKADRAVVDPADLHDHVARLLPEHMVPSTIQVVDELAHTANGKIDRAGLGRWTGATTAVAPAGGEAPRTDLEHAIAAVWTTVLAVPAVGRDDNFFDLGGDSLHAAKLAGELIDRVPEAAQVFFDELLREVLEHPSVAELAAFLAVGPPGQHERGGPSPDASTDPRPALRGLGGTGPVRYIVAGPGAERLADALAQLGGVSAIEAADDAGLGADRVAARVVSELRRAGPAGCVHIVGTGTGATLALELARQLTEVGDEPGSLTLVAPDRPGGGTVEPAPYVADITVVVSDLAGDDVVQPWADVCLGRLIVHRIDVDDDTSVLACLGPEGRSNL